MTDDSSKLFAGNSTKSLTCCACKERFGDVWTLLKHSYNVHGLRVCQETLPESDVSVTSTSSPTSNDSMLSSYRHGEQTRKWRQRLKEQRVWFSRKNPAPYLNEVRINNEQLLLRTSERVGYQSRRARSEAVDGSSEAYAKRRDRGRASFSIHLHLPPERKSLPTSTLISA